ncbi:hypothetical protein CWR48_15745, partial [Oceanobacillus arenosus]
MVLEKIDIEGGEDLASGAVKINKAIDASDKAQGDASNALSKSSEAIQTATKTSEDMQAIIREQTQNGDLAPEVAQARDGYATLGDNLNSIHQNLAQMASLSYVDAILASLGNGAPKEAFFSLP